MDNSKIAARIIIEPEFYDEKNKLKVNVREYYGDWYKFDNEQLDVSLYSISYLDKEKKETEKTYFYKLPNGSVKLIAGRHCKIIYEFL